MKDEMSKTRKCEREIISVSLPLPVYFAMMDVCDHYNMNRSSMVASAIAEYLKSLGVRIGED